MIEAALRGEERPQYTSGPAGRAADIEVGAQRSAAELVADARLWADRFADVVHSVGDDQWDIIVQAGIGPRPIRQRVFGRRNEVEVHHVDLDLGYLPAAWPDEWVVAQLRRNVELIPERYLGGAPAGTWSVIADGVGAWTFGIDADVVSMAEGAASDAHATATGPPYAVHAWLLGRQDGSELEVAGDPVIRDLPRYFPWA
jgi:maleylpyruvate isomerase